MNDKYRRALYVALSVAILLMLWEVASRIVDADFVVPGVLSTLRVFGKLLINAKFYKTLATSVLRILFGFAIGVAIAVMLSFFTLKFDFVRSFVSIVMTVVRSTPVASFILVLWVIFGSASVPVIIASLIVMPVVWQNLQDGFGSVDKELSEVATVFGFSLSKRIKYLVVPTLREYFFPALITAIGLAWKSGIAAEIIAYTKNSIGKEIYDAKSFFEGEAMYAWTLTVILLSLLFEFFIKRLMKSISRKTTTGDVK